MQMDDLQELDTQLCCISSGQKKSNHHAAGWQLQFRALYWRSIVTCTRNPLDMGARVLTSCWLGVFVGLVFLRLGSGTVPAECYTIFVLLQGQACTFAADEKAAEGRVLCIADSLLVLIVMPFVYMPLMMSNKETLAREAPANLYSNMVYYCAVSLANLPVTVLTALAFAWPVYSLAGFRHSVTALVQASCIYALQHLCSTQASTQISLLDCSNLVLIVPAILYFSQQQKLP